MNDKTELGFPKDRVHTILRQILSPSLHEKEAEGVVVVLLCHLLIEGRINDVIYECLAYDAPFGSNDTQKEKEEFFKKIEMLPFAVKYSLFHEQFKLFYPAEAPYVWQVNELRKDMLHGRNLEGAVFEGKGLREPETIERVFEIAQAASYQLGRFLEHVDRRRVVSEKAMAKLKELGIEIT